MPSKQEAYTCEDFSFFIEMERGEAFVHIDVFRWSKEVFWEIVRVFEHIKTEAWNSGRTSLYTYTQNSKFVEMFGGQFRTTISHAGEDFEVYEWRLG